MKMSDFLVGIKDTIDNVPAYWKGKIVLVVFSFFKFITFTDARRSAECCRYRF